LVSPIRHQPSADSGIRFRRTSEHKPDRAAAPHHHRPRARMGGDRSGESSAMAMGGRGRKYVRNARMSSLSGAIDPPAPARNRARGASAGVKPIQGKPTIGWVSALENATRDRASGNGQRVHRSMRGMGRFGLSRSGASLVVETSGAAPG
jgi:hypothetical protein